MKICARVNKILSTKLASIIITRKRGQEMDDPTKGFYLTGRDRNTTRIKEGRNERYYDMYINNQHQQKESGLKTAR